MTHDPFVNHHFHLEHVDRGFLTDEDIQVIMKKEFQLKGWNKYGTCLFFLVFVDWHI